MAFSARVESSAISNINVTPLVDVLLVLLIIFMITAPVITHKTRIDLPQGSHKTIVDQADTVRLTIHADGALYWNDIPVDEPQLKTQLAIAAQQNLQPRLSIDAADGAAYQAVAHVLSEAKAQGLSRIDFAASH
ncbi:biopolymer transport protein ExbD [Dyella sp. OK004]|uniref:ExbD/TolR family protein n=1 Tax=Dyella sp. OK004 TaxID=1855292 RepID=UPI0008E1B9B0|nr:biopolymer transporter ExbD [Dyella sp. OK004]SFS19120.1 biopolymer transport protein ExbD [Dyella sp. OK004]